MHVGISRLQYSRAALFSSVSSHETVVRFEPDFHDFFLFQVFSFAMSRNHIFFNEALFQDVERSLTILVFHRPRISQR
jgi:hypothetical protein